jgi:hypothetical protein
LCGLQELSPFFARPIFEQDLLRYQSKKGEKLEYQFAQMCSIKVKTGAQDTEMLSFDQLMELFWTVRDLTADGKALILVKMNSVRLKASLLGGLIKAEQEQGKPLLVDFAGKPTGFFENLAFHHMLGPRLGSAYEVSRDARGVIGATPSKSDRPYGFLSFLGAAPEGPEELRTLLGPGALVFSREKVTKGDSWTEKVPSLYPERDRPKNPPKKTKEGEQRKETQIPEITMTLVHAGKVQKKGRSLVKIMLQLGPETLPKNGGWLGPRVIESKAEGTAYVDEAAGRLVELSVTTKWVVEQGLFEIVTERFEHKLTLQLK